MVKVCQLKCERSSVLKHVEGTADDWHCKLRRLENMYNIYKKLQGVIFDRVMAPLNTRSIN